MTYEGFQTFIYPVIDILAVLTVIFAAKALFSIRRQKRDIEAKNILIRIFTLLALGYALWALAEIAWDIHSLIAEEAFEYSIFADPLWVIGYIPVVGGFAYLSYKLFKSHKEQNKGIYVIILAAAIALLVGWIVKTSIIPYVWEEGVLLGLLGLYYPIASAVAMISALTVFFFFRKAKIATPFLLLAIALLFSFAGDILFTYEAWNELGYGVWGILYDSFYAMEYAIAAAAFYLFSKKAKQ